MDALLDVVASCFSEHLNHLTTLLGRGLLDNESKEVKKSSLKYVVSVLVLMANSF
jgi:hypothetical protein